MCYFFFLFVKKCVIVIGGGEVCNVEVIEHNERKSRVKGEGAVGAMRMVVNDAFLPLTKWLCLYLFVFIPHLSLSL